MDGGSVVEFGGKILTAGDRLINGLIDAGASVPIEVWQKGGIALAAGLGAGFATAVYEGFSPPKSGESNMVRNGAVAFVATSVAGMFGAI